MKRRPIGRGKRIAVLTLTIALLAGGAFFAAPHQSVQSALARALAGDASDLDKPVQSPHVLAPPQAPEPAQAGAAVSPPPEEPSFSSSRVAPHLVSVEPRTSGVAVSTAIVMEFSQPMDAASVEASFVIEPKVNGRFVWNEQTLRFEPFKLRHATIYDVEVRGRSTLGKPLAGARSWTFSTGSAPPDQVLAGPAAIKVPILTYHYIRSNPDPRDGLGFALSVTPADFAAQMDWLARAGYHTITTEDLYQYVNRARGLPSKPVILTFDDGYADFYTSALPVLRSHEFTATAYVVSGFVGHGGYMTQEQIREVDHSGIEIGSHSVHHANLARSSMANVRAEVGDSKRYLEELVGHPVNSFCYPSGKWHAGVANAVAAAGYHDSTTTAFGFWHGLGDRYMWTRLRVGGGQSLGDFGAAVAGAS